LTLCKWEEYILKTPFTALRFASTTHSDLKKNVGTLLK
jgi:hypothetical protein